MTCKEAIEQVAEYLDRELTPGVLAELEAHLELCAPCRAYLATYRRTKELTAKVNRVVMPEEMKERLRRFLLGELRKTT